MSTASEDPALVPELLVRDLAASLAFWGGLCGFELVYERQEEGFACIALGAARLLLEQEGIGRNWVPAALERPLGRGINLQIAVPETSAVITSLEAVGWPLFQPLETRWYRAGDVERGVEQFLVQDPDGYLLRFQSSAGSRRRR